MAGVLSGIGNFISGLGRSVDAPDLGLGAALGGGLPGLIQGTNPSTYQGVGVAPASPMQNVSNTVAAPQQTPKQTPTVQPTSTPTAGSPAAAAPAPADPRFAQQTGEVGDLINQLNGLYGTLFSNFNQGIAGQRQSIDQNYADQQNALNTQYEQTAPQLQRMEAARGLSDSSYANTQQQNANNTYQAQTQGIGDARLSAEQQLAANAANQLGTYQGQQQGFQDVANNVQNILPTDSNANYELSSIIGQLAGGLESVKGAIGSAQNSGQLASLLNLSAPSTVYNASNLQGQLSALAKSSVPQFAQNQIASGAINNNTTDPATNAYWLQQWQNMTAPQAT